MLDKKTIAALNNDFSDISRDELINIFNEIRYYLDSPNNYEGIRLSDYVKDEKIKKDILNYQKIIGLIQSEIMKKEQTETKTEEIVKVEVTEEQTETNNSTDMPIVSAIPKLSEYITDEETKSKLEKYEDLRDNVVTDESGIDTFTLTEGTKKLLIEENIKRFKDHYDSLYRNESDSKNNMNDFLEILMASNLNDMVLKYTKAKTMQDLLDEVSKSTSYSNKTM